MSSSSIANNIEVILKKVRYLNPRACDRTIELIKYCKNPVFDVKIVQELQLVAIGRNADKLKTLLDKIELNIMKSCGFNFVIHNVPSHASEIITNDITPTNYDNIRATLEQFGNIDALKVIRGSAYTRFTNTDVCHTTHSLINNMQIGSNIITTMVV